MKLTMAERLALAARQFIGSPFHLHGRDPLTGMDCVGLVLLSLQSIGIKVRHIPPYSLRQIGDELPEEALNQVGFARTLGAVGPGDLLLTQPGPAQLHLLIAGNANCAIHSHAGLRRVVETPMPLPWPILRKWRLSELG